jgi:hypothetical protein
MLQSYFTEEKRLISIRYKLYFGYLSQSKRKIGTKFETYIYKKNSSPSSKKNIFFIIVISLNRLIQEYINSFKSFENIFASLITSDIW